LPQIDAMLEKALHVERPHETVAMAANAAAAAAEDAFRVVAGGSSRIICMYSGSRNFRRCF
jgi:hypothetical protein